MNNCYYVFYAGGYDITVTTGSRFGAGTNSVMNYRLQGTNGDSGTRVFPGQEPDMFEQDRCSITHLNAADFILLKVKQITPLAIGVYGCNFKYVLYPSLNEVEGGILVSPCPSVCPFVRLSVCGQNRVRSVSSTILAGSISYLNILSSKFRGCRVWSIVKNSKMLFLWQFFFKFASLSLPCIHVMWVLKVDSSTEFLQQILIFHDDTSRRFT